MCVYVCMCVCVYVWRIYTNFSRIQFGFADDGLSLYILLYERSTDSRSECSISWIFTYEFVRNMLYKYITA